MGWLDRTQLVKTIRAIKNGKKCDPPGPNQVVKTARAIKGKREDD